MRRRNISRIPFLLCLGLCLLTSPRALADDKDGSEDAKFESFDRVELKGRFYPGDKKSPCVILLHKYGGNCSKDDDLTDLAVALNKDKKFAVLMFDFRGHGDSTSIKNPNIFWSLPDNMQGVSGFDRLKPKTTMSFKDFKTSYTPYLVNDISAARMFLDRKNDDGVCNSRSIVLVGAEDGAVLGSMWAYSEMYRFKFLKGALRPDTEPEGTDIMGAVWISMTPNLNRNSERALTWITDIGKTHKVPMAFIFGDKDLAGKTFAANAMKDLQPEKGNKFVVSHPIKDQKLTGTKLLSKELDTQKEIVNYLTNLKEDKGVANWDTKDSKKVGSIWLFKGGLVQRQAKAADEESFSPLPTMFLRQ